MRKGGIPMKKFLALTMAGVMLFATPVFASKSPDASSVAGNSGSEQSDCGASSAGSASPVEASVVPADIVAAAAAEGKTVGEYMNNAVVTVPGLDYAVPVGQGGHVIINGAPSNQVFSVLKPALANVYTAKAYAAALGGRVLSVVRINANITGFQTARVNFYMKGVWPGQNIKVFQIINGRCYELHVAEIRTDHVVVDMTSLGTLAFLEVPNK